jgi:hypothetical protein
VNGAERLIIVASFNDKAEHIRIKLTPEAASAFGLDPQTQYVGRDLLRSGADIGLTADFSFELDVPPFSSFILKVK